MLKKKYQSKGFTLIELLVVVAIISLLSSIVLASLNSARAKGRNAARLQSVETLRTVFYLSLTDTGSLPSTGGTYYCVAVSCYEGLSSYATNATIDAFLAPSLPQKPADPTGGNRGYGGFLYRNPLNISGNVGAYINYVIEPPGNCGAGVEANPGVGLPNYRDCFLKID